MSREEFRSNCELSGGTYSGNADAQICEWPNGAYIICDGTSCTSVNGRVTGSDDNVPQYDPNYDKPQSRYEASTAYETEIQWSEAILLR
ncbi:MAG: hypothetical protein GY928_19785 [Colwellia sp.]|nr:hypothetical protein [Colwellia sp.]